MPCLFIIIILREIISVKYCFVMYNNNMESRGRHTRISCLRLTDARYKTNCRSAEPFSAVTINI